MAYALSPIANAAQYFDSNGKPLAGGLLFTYQAGSFSTQQTTYDGSGEPDPNPNPIVLDSSGYQTLNIWLDTTWEYQFVLTKPDGTTVIWSIDNISA